MRIDNVSWPESGAPAHGLRVHLGDAAPEPLESMQAPQPRHKIASATRDSLANTPDPALLSKLTPRFMLRNLVLPLREENGTTLILCAENTPLHIVKPVCEQVFGPVTWQRTSAPEIRVRLEMRYRDQLAAAAETQVPAKMSCRTWNPRRLGLVLLSVILMLIGWWFYDPSSLLIGLCVLAVFTLLLQIGLKATATLISTRLSQQVPKPILSPELLPIVTIFVPLFHEREIAQHLLAQLMALDYPPDKLDICILLEEDDVLTRRAIDATILPDHIRFLEVPRGNVQTKPRALNYGLNFAHGEIIGIYDAEDSPEPMQIRRVAEAFRAAPNHVACMQGYLDYYNSSQNWLARCFTIEYATWFRVVLPGLAQLGLVVPLGGTTLFFRRDVLEAVGGWDAHNVTEDADLGVRLARFGYSTWLVSTVTEEEANCRLWRWIRQRSRWQKGYVATYMVHMRDPVALFHDLGLRRFAGFQVLFLGTICQFALAPFLWTFWLSAFGGPHPMREIMPGWGFIVLGSVFLMTEVLSISVGALGVLRAQKPWLAKWALTLGAYFPFAVFAFYKGVAELIIAPFYWDKTDHGVWLEHRIQEQQQADQSE